MVEVLQVAVGASSAGGALHCSAGHSAICHVLPMLGLRGSGFACFFSHRWNPADHVFQGQNIRMKQKSQQSLGQTSLFLPFPSVSLIGSCCYSSLHVKC